MIRLTGVQLDLGGLAGGHPLWVDASLGVPVSLLAVATELATERGPLAICREGRLTWAGVPFPLGHNFGRTVRGTRLVDPDGGVWHGTVIEVAADEQGASLAHTLGHEFAHCHGSPDELEAERLGDLLARASRR